MDQDEYFRKEEAFAQAIFNPKFLQQYQDLANNLHNSVDEEKDKEIHKEMQDILNYFGKRKPKNEGINPHAYFLACIRIGAEIVVRSGFVTADTGKDAFPLAIFNPEFVQQCKDLVNNLHEIQKDNEIFKETQDIINYFGKYKPKNERVNRYAYLFAGVKICMIGVIGSGLVTVHAVFENGENGEISHSEKEQKIMEWMYSQKYIEHIQSMMENVVEIGQWDQVQKLLFKLADLVNDFKDKDTDTINLQIFKVAFFKALINMYVAQVDFEISGK